jgi:hypothetical protein
LKKLFFVYELRSAPPVAVPGAAALPSDHIAVLGCDCDCGLSSFTYLCCKDGRWAKQAAVLEFKCVALLSAKDARALSVCSTSWLSLLGVEQCKHKLPLSWILPPEALSISTDKSAGPYASVTLLPGVVAKATEWSPLGPLVMRLMSQQPGCADLPGWFVKTKHR